MKPGDPPRGASVEHHQLKAVQGQLQRSRMRVLVGRWTAAWAVVVAATAQYFGHMVLGHLWPRL